VLLLNAASHRFTFGYSVIVIVIVKNSASPHRPIFLQTTTSHIARAFTGGAMLVLGFLKQHLQHLQHLQNLRPLHPVVDVGGFTEAPPHLLRTRPGLPGRVGCIEAAALTGAGKRHN